MNAQKENPRLQPWVSEGPSNRATHSKNSNPDIVNALAIIEPQASRTGKAQIILWLPPIGPNPARIIVAPATCLHSRCAFARACAGAGHFIARDELGRTFQLVGYTVAHGDLPRFCSPEDAAEVLRRGNEIIQNAGGGDDELY